jgi:hypothetical protein
VAAVAAEHTRVRSNPCYLLAVAASSHLQQQHFQHVVLIVASPTMILSRLDTIIIASRTAVLAYIVSIGCPFV